MDRAPRIALVALLLVAVPAAAAGLPAANVGAGTPIDAGEPLDRTASPGTDDPADASGTPAGSSPGSAADVPSDGSALDGPSDGSSAGDPPDRAERDRPRADGNGTPARLRLDGGDVESTYVTPTPDLPASLGTGDDQIEAGYGLYWHRYRIERADNASQRRERIAAALSYVVERIEHLEAREAAAIRAYHNGSADAEALAGELAAIDARAETISGFLRDLRSYDVVGRQLENDIQNANRGAQLLEGPARKRIREGHAAQSADVVVHVSASRGGLVLETIAGGEYAREAVRHDHRDPDVQGDSDDIREQMSRLYPETFSPQPDAGWSWFPTHESGLFWVNFVVQQGTVTLYFDSGTDRVYRERQVLQLSELPTERVASRTAGGLTVTVDRADGGNPVVVNVSAIGRAVDAIVEVDGQRVGRTGDDGELWTVAPSGEYEVTVVGPGDTVNVTVPAESTAETEPTAGTGTTATDAVDPATDPGRLERVGAADPARPFATPTVR